MGRGPSPTVAFLRCGEVALKHRFLITFVALLTSHASLSLAGPSFDCAKASTLSEYTICADQGLSALDVELAIAYKRALAASSDTAFLKSRQKAWVAQREQCGSADCIRSLYIQRLSELGGSASAQSSGDSITSATSVDLTNTFVVANALPPDDFLSLRTEPSAKSGSRIEKMPNGTVLKVIQRRSDGWWLVQNLSSGLQGWAKSGNGQKSWIIPNPAAAQALAAAQAKKAAAEKARLQAEADAKSAAKAKAEADTKAKRDANAKLAEQAAKADAIALISAILGKTDPLDVFVFLNQGSDAPNLAKNLDGKLVSSSGTISVCYTTVTSGLSGEQNTRYVTNVENFLAKSLPEDAQRNAVPLDYCGTTTKPDAIYFQVQHLSGTSSKFLDYLAGNLAGPLVLVGSYSSSQASADEQAYQQKVKDQLAAAEQRSQEILKKALAGRADGYAILSRKNSKLPICFAADDVIDRKSIDIGSASEVLSTWLKSDAAAKSMGDRIFEARKSADAIYIALTKADADCGGVFGSYKVLSKFAVAMQRDKLEFIAVPIEIDPHALNEKVSAASKHMQEEARAASIAKSEEEKQRADQQRHADEEVAAADAARKSQLPPFRAYVTCLLNGDINKPRSAYACMIGNSNSPDGAASITNNGQHTVFTTATMAQTFKQTVTVIDLSEDFEISLQANSEEYFVLSVEIRDQNDQVVFQRQASQYSTIYVAGSTLSSLVDEGATQSVAKEPEVSQAPNGQCFDREAAKARLGLSIATSEIGYQFCFGYIDYLAFLNKEPIGIHPNSPAFAAKAQTFKKFDDACYNNVRDAMAGSRRLVEVVDANDFNGLKDTLNLCTNMMEEGGL